MVGYHPKVGLPKDDAGNLLLDFEFAPIKRERPPQIDEPTKVRRGVPRPAQGTLL